MGMSLLSSREGGCQQKAEMHYDVGFQKVFVKATRQAMLAG